MRFYNAHQIVEELRLYRSTAAVHRGVRNGEIPPPTQYGSAYLWREDEIMARHEERRGDLHPKRPKIIVRRSADA